MGATSFESVPSPLIFSTDAGAMTAALALAKEALAEGDFAIAAMVLDSAGHALSARHDEVRSASSPTAHAVVLALQDAASKTGSWRLIDTTLVVTREPCALCAGAAVAARVRRVVFATADDQLGCLGSRYNFGVDPRLNHEFEIVSGLEAQVAGLLFEESR